MLSKKWKNKTALLGFYLCKNAVYENFIYITYIYSYITYIYIYIHI